MPYFDHNATTPLSSAARAAWLKATDENWHNPSSLYRDAARAKIQLDQLRAKLATFLDVKPTRLVFTSGATESANAVIRWISLRAAPTDSIALNRTEHPAVLEAARAWFGDRIEWIDTNENGVVKMTEIEHAITAKQVAAVAVMAANNETGVIQPWGKIAELCRGTQTAYICDAAQWLGKLPASGLGKADYVFGSAHKFGGPKGVGFLTIPDSASGFSAQFGGEQEHGHRAGTENLPAIAGMVAAICEAEEKRVFLEEERLRWRDDFVQRVCTNTSSINVIGASADRLWNTLSLLMPFGENHRWVSKLDRQGFQISTGSACASGNTGPSHVLTALGYSADSAKSTIRISAGWETQPSDWTALADAIDKVSAELKNDQVGVTRK